MTLHLVTAAQAEDHISSSDDARLYEALVGSGGIVFSQGNKMSASMTDPNTMRIMDGVALLCGRYWNITNYEEVTITNGTPGMNSIALVVANIKTDPSETLTLKVYEGVETEGEPVMPSYIEGNLNGGDTEAEMPLYAVTKTGLSVGDPVPQFEVFLSEKKFRDSISQFSDPQKYENTAINSKVVFGTLFAQHNKDNSIIKLYGNFGIGTNVCSVSAIPGLLIDGNQAYGIKSGIRFDVNTPSYFRYIGLYSESVSGSNKNNFYHDSASIGIGSDGYVYFSPKTIQANIGGNTNRWTLLNIPLFVGA